MKLSGQVEVQTPLVAKNGQQSDTDRQEPWPSDVQLLGQTAWWDVIITSKCEGSTSTNQKVVRSRCDSLSSSRESCIYTESHHSPMQFVSASTPVKTSPVHPLQSLLVSVKAAAGGLRSRNSGVGRSKTLFRHVNSNCALNSWSPKPFLV